MIMRSVCFVVNRSQIGCKIHVSGIIEISLSFLSISYLDCDYFQRVYRVCHHIFAACVCVFVLKCANDLSGIG